MKLYYSPGVCSLASHIVLREAGLPFAPVRVDLNTHTFDDGANYYAINQHGYVPLLELGDGQRLTEGPAIMQYVADRVPEKKLAPAWGTMERYRLVEWLAFISSELHRNFGPLFNPAMPDDVREYHCKRVLDRFQWVDRQLDGKTYLVGDTYTVADAYLFVVANWGKLVGVDLGDFKNLNALLDRVSSRAAVEEALKIEGLI
ncbi:glutathione S-transferase (plasmid) [Ensifer sp. WSM1721]|uniref:glutathione transferase GstA n=1 Tax=Ensifer sp. WSM1721 TaxID=1041159 RepID=UPI0004796757|nr:glutathione transferase GstA [Ensifer sp. WSM1721]